MEQDKTTESMEHEDFVEVPRRAQVEEDEPGDTDASEGPSGDGATAVGRKSVGRRAGRWVGEALLILVGALVISTLLRNFVAQPFIIPTGSMQHTLEIDDRVLVSKFGGFQRGDVVVFEDPAHWLSDAPAKPGPLKQALEFVGVLPSSSQEHLIKRVIGMPGDHVRCCTDAGQIEINGVGLDESAYLYSEGGTQVAPSACTFDVVVPADHIFVMGDHRNASADSRVRLNNVTQGKPQGSAAFVPVDKVVGASVAIVAPLDRLSLFHVPEAFRSVPAPAEPAPAQAKIIHAEPGC